jgi:hypothetical protein
LVIEKDTEKQIGEPGCLVGSKTGGVCPGSPSSL